VSAPRIPGTRETITLGPFPIFFCNTNTAMALKSHCHLADVWVAYETLGLVGYPSFQATNDRIRSLLRSRTGVERPFRDSTNEDVTRELFAAVDAFIDPAWEADWPGGVFRLHAIHLDVKAAEDRIGHDPGATRYTVERAHP
jgi:hypothetical protein